MNFNELKDLHTNLAIANDIVVNVFNVEDPNNSSCCKQMFKLDRSKHTKPFSTELCISFGLPESVGNYDNTSLKLDVAKLDKNVIAEYLLKYLDDNAFEIFYKVVKLMNSEFETAKAQVVDELEQKVKDITAWDDVPF